MKSDIEIAQETKLTEISKIAIKLGYSKDELELYGKYIAKVSITDKPIKGKLILVTAMNPTPFGEGKTTVAIGLADALAKMKKSIALALREPSLGPVFGIKGGACGGGYSQVLPMEEINLHFTGDFHAVTAANNLLSAMIDNHIFQGNQLNIKEVIFSRCLDVNDRALRRVDIHQTEEIGRKEQFTISIYKTPAYIHCGPFANIAHGCNSIVATKEALAHADIVITEAGFGSELGGEKFLDIKCREMGIAPEAVVLVVTIRGIKYNGEDDIVKGFENVKRHIKNLKQLGMNIVVAINKFPTDTAEEIDMVMQLCEKSGAVCIPSTAFSDGPAGCIKLAEAVLDNMKSTEINYVYEMKDTVKDKILKIVTKLYGASDVQYSEIAETKLKKIENKGQYVCIAKTQYSFSHNSKLLGAPENFVFEVNDIIEKTGSNFIVVISGKMLLMPGLPKVPNSEKMHIDTKTLIVSGLM